MPRRAILLAFVAFPPTPGLAGRVSVRRDGTRDVAGRGGGLAVRVLADGSAGRARRPGPAGMTGQVKRLESSARGPASFSLAAAR